MKQTERAKQLNTLPDVPGNESIARIIPLRSETILSRRPVHRLSKRGLITIKEVKRDSQGKVTSSWEVRNPPGPLAYKIDTLIINRRIEESRPKVPKLLKLGSLHEICRELGLADSGKNRNDIKEALHQNAGAYIIARLEYDDKDGMKRTFEFGSSRYAVFFVGETLPNGKRADAVYIYFHDMYLTLITQAPTRPLDYCYLRQLPSAAQRVYELVSFALFGAIKHARKCATVLYSDLCAAAPLTRYYDWDRVRPQLWKIHRPHIESGYLKAADTEAITDAEGRPDWIIRYIPGPKARREYRHFNERPRLGDSQPKPPARPRLVGASTAGGQPSAPARRPEDAALIEKLMSYDVDERSAAQLVESDRAESALWAEAWQYQNKKGMDNPAAVLVSFIRNKRRPLPKGYIEAVRCKETEQQQARRLAEELHFRHFAPVFHSEVRRQLRRIERARPEAYKAFREHFDERHAEDLRLFESEDLREEFTMRKAIEFFNELRPELGARLTTFEEWNRNENGENADPVEWFSRNKEAHL